MGLTTPIRVGQFVRTNDGLIGPIKKIICRGAGTLVVECIDKDRSYEGTYGLRDATEDEIVSWHESVDIRDRQKDKEIKR